MRKAKTKTSVFSCFSDEWRGKVNLSFNKFSSKIPAAICSLGHLDTTTTKTSLTLYKWNSNWNRVILKHCFSALKHFVSVSIFSVNTYPHSTSFWVLSIHALQRGRRKRCYPMHQYVPGKVKNSKALWKPGNQPYNCKKCKCLCTGSLLFSLGTLL